MNGAWLTFFGVVIVALAGAAGTLGASWIAKRSEARSAAGALSLEERVVNRADFDAVMDRMTADLERADKRMIDLESRLELEVTARAAAEERAIQAEDRALQAEARAQRLERRVTQLEGVMRTNGMAVPPDENERTTS